VDITARLVKPSWEMLSAAYRIFHVASMEERREIIAAAIRHIKVFNTYLTIEYNFPITASGRITTRIHIPHAK
jgi:hypothetical protein